LKTAVLERRGVLGGAAVSEEIVPGVSLFHTDQGCLNPLGLHTGGQSSGSQNTFVFISNYKLRTHTVCSLNILGLS